MNRSSKREVGSVSGEERRRQSAEVRIDRRRSAEDVADRIFSGYRPAKQSVPPVEEPPEKKPDVKEPEPPEPKAPVQDPDPSEN